MKNVFLFLIASVVFSCENKPQQAFVPDSSGNINHLTVVMNKKAWQGALGETVRNQIATVYEGLPLDEPRFSLRYLEPEAFTGFGRHGRNILWFRTSAENKFQLVQNQFARPQILAIVQGEDQEVMGEYIKENASRLFVPFKKTNEKRKLDALKNR